MQKSQCHYLAQGNGILQLEEETEEEEKEKEKNNPEINFSGKRRKKKLPNRNKILTKKTVIDKTKLKKLKK